MIVTLVFCASLLVGFYSFGVFSSALMSFFASDEKVPNKDETLMLNWSFLGLALSFSIMFGDIFYCLVR